MAKVPVRKTAVDITGFAPGSFGCHEALHMASTIASLVECELVDHEAIAARPDWLALAQGAQDALVALYNRIALEHLRENRG